MNITPINTFSISSLKNNKNQNFKGLWGKNTETSDYDELYEMKKNKLTAYYFPFMNESKEDIDKTISDFNSANIQKIKNNDVFVVQECKLCSVLPFTDEDYDNYLKSKSGEFTNIHNEVQDKYTSGNRKQIPATNQKYLKKENI